MSVGQGVDLATPTEAGKVVPQAIVVDVPAGLAQVAGPSSARLNLLSPLESESTVPPPLPPRKSTPGGSQYGEESPGMVRRLQASPVPPNLPPRRTGLADGASRDDERSESAANGVPGSVIQAAGSSSAQSGDVLSNIDVAAPLILLTEESPPIFDASPLKSALPFVHGGTSSEEASTKLELPPLAIILLGPLLLLLAYWRVSIFTLGGACLGSWYLWADVRRRERAQQTTKMEPFKEDREDMKRYEREDLNGSPESVRWM